MMRPITDEAAARAQAAARIARDASREVLTAVDLAMVELEQGEVARPALLMAAQDGVTQALRAAGRGHIDGYIAAVVTQGRSRRAAVEELRVPLRMSRSGVAGAFGRRSAARP